MSILADAFGGIGIKDNGNGNYTVPYGHGNHRMNELLPAEQLQAEVRKYLQQ